MESSHSKHSQVRRHSHIHKYADIHPAPLLRLVYPPSERNPSRTFVSQVQFRVEVFIIQPAWCTVVVVIEENGLSVHY